MRNWFLGMTACIGAALATYPAVLMLVSASAPRPGQLVPEVERLDLHLAPGGPPIPHEKALFRLINEGDSPVKILSIQSGCDCAVSHVEPQLVAPGGTALVGVEASLPETGERTVSLTVHTDSPVSPVVPLQLRMVGRNEPGRPHLLRAGGDLSYEGDWSADEPRSVLATTVQPPGAENPPLVTSDLPFLRIDLADVDERLTTNPAFAIRHYTYHVTFSPGPPRGRFSGRVTVQDPWDESRREIIPVFGETPAPIRAIPPRLVLTLSSTKAGAEAVFRVLLQDPQERPVVVPEDAEASPLSVRALAADGDAGAAFAIAIDEDAQPIAGCIYNVIVRPSTAASEGLIVPVMVREEG